ncbi:MAG: nitrogen fixation protein NifH [Anaerolineae bacterium]
MSWRDQLRNDPIDWLLETKDSGVRYLAMRDLLDCSPDDPELVDARFQAHQTGPIATIMSEMEDDGYWVKAGPGYNPKYRSTVWAMIMLAQLGASALHDERVARACNYVLDHMAAGGQFTTTSSGAPSGTVDCLQGNMCAALVDVGCTDERLDSAYEWMARTVTGEGIAPKEEHKAAVRYFAYKCGPLFTCGVNNNQSCAWGAVKVMLAFSKWPATRRTPLIKRAIKQGIDFLLGIDPATAEYPTPNGAKPNRAWWKFGFPVFYVTDLLQNVEALVALGYGHDKRLANALDFIRGKQDAEGRWPLEYDYAGKTWLDFGVKKQPNKWVTLRALRVLKAVA